LHPKYPAVKRSIPAEPKKASHKIIYIYIRLLSPSRARGFAPELELISKKAFSTSDE